MKSEYGKSQLGNITVDMVSVDIFSLLFNHSSQSYLILFYACEGDWGYERNDWPAVGRFFA